MTSVKSASGLNNSVEYDADPDGFQWEGDWSVGCWIRVDNGSQETDAYFLGDSTTFLDFMGYFGTSGGDVQAYVLDFPTEDNVVVGSAGEWIYATMTHVAGSTQYVAGWRKEGDPALSFHVLNSGSEFTATVYVNIGGSSIYYGDCGARSFFLYQDVLTPSQLLAKSAVLTVPGDSPLAFFDLDSTTGITDNLGTGSDAVLLGSFSEIGDPDVSLPTDGYRDSTVASVTGVDTLDIPWPQVLPHDRALLFFIADGLIATVNTPAGWELVQKDFSGVDTQTLAVYEIKDCTGSESGNVSVVTPGQGEAKVGIIVTLSGRDNAASLSFISFTDSSVEQAPPFSMDASGGTASSGDCVLAWYAIDKASAASSWSSSAPAGFTKREEGELGFSHCALHTMNGASAGPTGSVSSTASRNSGSGDAAWGAYVVSVPPSVSTEPSVSPFSPLPSVIFQSSNF